MFSKNSKSKFKYSYSTYFFMLLILTMLLMSGTFSRYATQFSGSGSTLIEPLYCGYQVGEISATSFSNSSYWSNSGTKFATNSPKSIQFMMTNYDLIDQNKVSNLDLNGSFSIDGPKDFFSNIAFQLLQIDDTNLSIPLMPQVRLDGDGKVIFPIDQNKQSIEYGQVGEFDLSKYKIDYSSLGTNKTISIIKYNEALVATISVTKFRKNSSYKYIYKRGYEYEMAGSSYIGIDLPIITVMDKPSEMDFYQIELNSPLMKMESIKENNVIKKIANKFSFNFTLIEYVNLNDQKFNSSVNNYQKIEFVQPNVPLRNNDGTSLAGDVKVVINYDSSSSPIYELIPISGYSYDASDYDKIINYTHSFTNSDNKTVKIGECLGIIYPISARVLFIQASQSSTQTPIIGGNN